jgi:hypothetical protein
MPAVPARNSLAFRAISAVHHAQLFARTSAFAGFNGESAIN